MICFILLLCLVIYITIICDITLPFLLRSEKEKKKRKKHKSKKCSSQLPQFLTIAIYRESIN